MLLAIIVKQKHKRHSDHDHHHESKKSKHDYEHHRQKHSSAKSYTPSSSKSSSKGNSASVLMSKVLDLVELYVLVHVSVVLSMSCGKRVHFVKWQALCYLTDVSRTTNKSRNDSSSSETSTPASGGGTPRNNPNPGASMEKSDPIVKAYGKGAGLVDVEHGNGWI